jgi:tetratricopeptide (TPR) repeat protein
MGRWAYIGSLTLLLIAQASAGHARAQANVGEANVQDGAAAPDEARALLDAGELAYAQGRFGDALDFFEASYRKRREAQTLRRIGDAADKLGSHARAIEALKSYLARVPDTRDRAFVESRIAANQAELDVVRQQTLFAASSAKARTDSEPKAAEGTTAAPAAALTQTKSESAGNHAGPFWLWAAGGAVVVAGIVVAAVVISAGASPSTSEPVRGNIGSAIQTLSSR